MNELPGKGRFLTIHLILVIVLLFDTFILPVELCTRTAILPETTVSTASPGPTATSTVATTTEQIKTTATVGDDTRYSVIHYLLQAAPLSCKLGDKEFGKYVPAPGSVIKDDSYAIVQCNSATHTLDDAVLIAKCNNGKLTSTSDCIPVSLLPYLFFYSTIDGSFMAL